MSKSPLRYAAAMFLLGSTHPVLPARLERPGASPSVAVPAPESPLPARAVGGGERVFGLGALRVYVVPAPSSAGRGEWNDSLQPDLFRAYITRAPRS